MMFLRGIALVFISAAWNVAIAADDAGSRQKTFASPEQAMEAFAAAISGGDMPALRMILGPHARAVLESGDKVGDAESRKRFATAYAESHKINKQGDAAWIVVGKDGWPLPIPVVQKQGVWLFDTKAGEQELLNRRIGRNELYTIQSVMAYVDAQQEYYLRNPSNDKLLQYAQKFASSPGKRDGLYYPTKAGEKPSPLGPLFDVGHAQGYRGAGGAKPQPYHGYYYRILKAQGPKAPGGAYDYAVKGKMIGGFALVAYPATYGNSGIMTFMVNHDGKVYEKNLGPRTAEIASKMMRFEVDDTWKHR